MEIRRREFLSAAAGVTWVASRALRAQTSDSRIDILLNEPGATIAPEIYGHFVEQAGAVVYDGIWVGENASVPNIGGIRRDVVEALKKIRPAVIRWPGGCFADQYDWRDGIGPREKRPRRTSFWLESPEWPRNAPTTGPQRYEPNAFGTVEFVRFCRLVGAQPYFGSNLRSLPSQEFWRWVEYCNSPAGTTTLADQRAADGEREPLNVRYWGVGNESWGCGGNFQPEEYASEFRRYSAWVPSYGVRPALIGAGPADNDREWTRRFFAKAGSAGLDHLWGWAVHHYSWNASGGRSDSWTEAKGDALQFNAEQYYEILRAAGEMDGILTSQWGVMAESDPRHRVKIVVDEWGAWHKPGTEPFPEALLGQQNTMRDAVLAGLTLDTFNRHADKVAMANVAQLVNFLQSPLLAHQNQICLTPTYHVFGLYADHQGGQSVRTVFSSADVSYTRNGANATIRGLDGSASVRGNQLTLTVTNPWFDREVEAEIAIRGGNMKSVSAYTLAASDPHAHNSFEQPENVAPKPSAIALKSGVVVHRSPAASVTKISFVMG